MNRSSLMTSSRWNSRGPPSSTNVEAALTPTATEGAKRRDDATCHPPSSPHPPPPRREAGGGSRGTGKELLCWSAFGEMRLGKERGERSLQPPSPSLPRSRSKPPSPGNKVGHARSDSAWSPPHARRGPGGHSGARDDRVSPSRGPREKSACACAPSPCPPRPLDPRAASRTSSTSTRTASARTWRGTLDACPDRARTSTVSSAGDKVLVNLVSPAASAPQRLAGLRQPLQELQGSSAKSTQGGYARFHQRPRRQPAPLPRASLFTDAAAIPLVFLTAWQMLVHKAKVRSGRDRARAGRGERRVSARRSRSPSSSAPAGIATTGSEVQDAGARARARRRRGDQLRHRGHGRRVQAAHRASAGSMSWWSTGGATCS